MRKAGDVPIKTMALEAKPLLRNKFLGKHTNDGVKKWLGGQPHLLAGTPLDLIEIWVGRGAVDLGLADGIAHVQPKMKEIFGDDVRFSRYGPKRGLFARFGAQIVGDALAQIEDRAQWARFGL